MLQSLTLGIHESFINVTQIYIFLFMHHDFKKILKKTLLRNQYSETLCQIVLFIKLVSIQSNTNDISGVILI